MRTIQPPSKLVLLDSQKPSRPSPWPRLILVAVLAGIVFWNVGVIRERYGTPSEAPGGSSAEKDTIVETASAALLAPSRALAAVKTAPDAPLTAPEEPTSSPAAPIAPPAGAPIATSPTEAAPVETPLAPAQAAPVRNAERAEAAGTPAAASPDTVLVDAATAGNGHALAHRVVAAQIRPGQAVATAIMEAGLTGEQAHQVVSALGGIFDFRRARPGEGFRIKLSPEGELELFDYERSPLESYVVRRKDGSLVGYKRELEVEREVVHIEGEIRSSLYGAMESAGADPGLAVLLANVLAWDVDFYRDTRQGDRFSIVVERQHHRGRHLGYGNILAAEYQGFVGNIRLFRYERENGSVGYYDEEGKSAQRAFLRAPLQVVRITSRYGSRRHPILGYTRQHRGVDYGAPTGTPVWSVGDGTVITAGRQGGYGNLVVVRHANGYTTWYAHLSRIDVRVGQRVRQQQTIGRVGATGMATGPHLHYEIRHQGRHINPLSLQLPPREPLPASMMPAYLAAIEPARALLDGVELVAQAPGAVPPP
jgi:murein DD-endopeptidase MepM/ murein hydrolase activator NlpD